MCTPVAMVFTLGYVSIQILFYFNFFRFIFLSFKMYSYPYCGATISCAEYFTKNSWLPIGTDAVSNQVVIASTRFTKGYNYMPVPESSRKLLKKGNMAYAYVGLITKIAWDTTGTAPYSDCATKSEKYSCIKLNNEQNWRLYIRAELDRYQETVVWKRKFSSTGNFTIKSFSTINNEETSETHILIK